MYRKQETTPGIRNERDRYSQHVDKEANYIISSKEVSVVQQWSYVLLTTA